MALVNLILKDIDPFPDDADWLYFKDKEVIFHRAGLQTRFSKSGIPDGWSILCCEIAYTNGDSISKMSEEDISYKVVEDIVNSHGGQIQLSSSSMGGLQVKISLPF